MHEYFCVNSINQKIYVRLLKSVVYGSKIDSYTFLIDRINRRDKQLHMIFMQLLCMDSTYNYLKKNVFNLDIPVLPGE